MRNNSYIAVAVGIGIFGVFAIFVALATVTSDNPDLARDEESVTPTVTSDNPDLTRDEESVTPAVTSDNPDLVRDEERVTPAVTSDNPNLTRDEKGVTLAAWKYTVYGPVRLPEAISRFEADGAKGLVTIRPGKEAGRLPVGQYHIRFWKTERKDDDGNTWVLTGQYFGQENIFEVNKGSETRLDVGEPIIATVEARNTGSSYSFNQIIKGRHQESIKLTRNGSRPQPPKLHIKNKDGSYEKTFKFHYG